MHSLLTMAYHHSDTENRAVGTAKPKFTHSAMKAVVRNVCLQDTCVH